MAFKRNQVEEAVWRLLSRDRAGRRPQAVFRTRVKRLLDLDRAAPASAFAAAAPPGRGHEARFAAFDAFCLALGLLLLNAGFKQREIVDLLRHLRPELAQAWRQLEASPAAPRQRILAEERPGSPSYPEAGLPLADTEVYLVLNRVETTEVFPNLAPGPDPGSPLVLEPLLVPGGERLAATLRERAFGFPGHYVVELSVMAALLRHYLADAAPRRRGQPGGQPGGG
ncbi:hypothetical protein [Thalassobaculum sp.]|uniref:hypothetical protein n=1 Tax=Thalassobaculum sp. TaxID=2022740 RepID=UPI0032EAA04B